MCTLTFLPMPDGNFVITSNRDEEPSRETEMPVIYEREGTKLLYPRDVRAGGTWIGVSDKKRFVSLMNGGFTAHKRKDSYRMSRGLVVTDLLVADDLLGAIEAYDLEDVEPFTVVAVDWAKAIRIYEFVWDGREKHVTEKPLAPAIWSSSLLYSEEMKQKRMAWFSEFLFNKVDPGSEDILEFHHQAGDGDIGTSLIMDRYFVKTRSITQLLIGKEIEMTYEDLQTQKKNRTVL